MPTTLTGRAAAPGLDVLAEEWWLSFEAADAAVRAARGQLPDEVIAAESRRLANERTQIIRLLRDLGHDLNQHCRLVGWLGTSKLTNRMLGLPSTIAACIFDLDGALTTSTDVHVAAWTATFDEFLLEQADLHHRPFVAFDPRHEYVELLAGRPRLDGVRTFLASRGFDLPEGDPGDEAGAPTVNGLANRKNRLLRQHLDHEGVSAFESSRDYLAGAGVARLGRAVVSPSLNTRRMLERAGLARLVDIRIDGQAMAADDLLAKPAPDTVLAACGRLGVEPEHAAAFETTLVGVSAARAAGVGFVVAVDRGGEAGRLRTGEADVVVDDLTELLAAPSA